jgi:hypothetical protein
MATERNEARRGVFGRDDDEHAHVGNRGFGYDQEGIPAEPTPPKAVLFRVHPLYRYLSQAVAAEDYQSANGARPDSRLDACSVILGTALNISD